MAKAAKMAKTAKRTAGRAAATALAALALASLPGGAQAPQPLPASASPAQMPAASAAAGSSAPANAVLRPGMTLTSTAFADGAVIPDRYTQAAENHLPVSPALRWDFVPEGTVSFTLLVQDPDTAPQKGVAPVLHWLIFNLPGSARELPEAVPAVERLPDGSIQARNRAGKPGYLGMGARAPGPYHHYVFELFALDTRLDLGPEASRDDVLKAMDGHVLAKAAVVGRFHRPS